MPLFDDLLSRGYFPIQLPPGFTTSSFSDKRDEYEDDWPANIPMTMAERFSVPRSSYYRRNTAILNPIGFYHLAKKVSRYWNEINEHYEKSTSSRSIPSLGGTLRAIKLTKFSELQEDKVTSSAGFRFALVTDISSFFPTIYTHSIPWAIHSKAIAKANRQRTDEFFGNWIDVRCQTTQDGQTIGLPIGPDTSHIIAETIGVAIDLEVESSLGAKPAGFRYVDDFYLFFNERSDAERALAAIIKAAGIFELQINPAKTRIVEVQDIVEDSWKFSVKKLRIGPKRRAQRNDLHHYFEVLLSLERRFKDESIVKYGLKQLSSMIVKKPNWDVLEAYLYKCGYGFPNTIQIIAHFLATYQFHGYDIDHEAVTRFCNNLLLSCAASDHHGEVAWLLWISKELGVTLTDAAVLEVAKMGSPACTLVLLDLHYSGLAPKEVPIEYLEPHANSTALKGQSWLLAYEAGRRNWLGNRRISYIRNDPHFGPLLRADVEFYDPDRRLPPMFKLKQDIDADAEFDSDDDIADDFDFDDMDEEYFDADDEHYEDDSDENDEEEEDDD
ncbi:RNA-directed DNA polymerase [Lysobacter brunescens]